jgi:hypothetical protein
MSTISYQLIVANRTNRSGSATNYLLDPIDAVELTRGMDCVPAKLTFSVVKDDVMSFTEGDPVTFSVNGTTVFKGNIFEKQRSGRTNIIKVTAYDQIVYLVKNSDCYVYQNKTANEVLDMICTDYKLTEGDFANTQYKVSHVDDNKTLADIVMYALDQTLINTQGHYYYHIYDDAGKIVLASQSSMKIDALIDNTQMEDYEYKSSIDKDTYDMVKIVRKAPNDNGAEKLTVTGVASDDEHINQWGRLQHVMKPDDKDLSPVQFAQSFLALHDCKTREISLRGVFGDIRVRGGTLLYVQLDLGDIKLDNYMLVSDVKHHFSQNSHTMDIDLMYFDQSGNYTVTYDNDAAVLTSIEDAKTKTSMSNGTISGTTSSSLVDAGFSAADGRISALGADGCVDTATYIGSYYNTDLKAEYDAGVEDVPTLCNDLAAKGYHIDTYDGSASKGDLLIYGDQDHVTVADGAGGCYGNSSTLGHEVYYSNADSAYDGSSAPTQVIHMDGS